MLKGGLIQSVSKKLVHFARKTTLFNTIYIKQWRLACKVHKFFLDTLYYLPNTPPKQTQGTATNPSLILVCLAPSTDSRVYKER